MATVIELKEQRSQIWERMKQIVDTAEAENRNLSAEEDANWAKANGDISELEQRIDRQERLERTPSPTAPPPTEKATDDWRQYRNNPRALAGTPAYSRAFSEMLRSTSRIDLDPETRAILAAGFVPLEQRAMGVATGAGGGFLAPDSFVARVEQALLEFGGMRSVATIMRTADGNDIAMPTSNDTTNTGELLAENTAASEQDLTVGQVVLKSYMYSSKIIKASYQFLQDAAIDVEGWLAARIAERIGRITNTHFTTGAGANLPSGIVTGATSGVSGATGQTTIVTWDDLISLEHSIDPAYRGPGCRYMFADSTLQAIRKLKDGNGQYLWQPASPTLGTPSMINGWPYTINQDVAVMAASAKSVLFGRLDKYIIRDVRGLAVMRLEERYAEYLQVGFLGFSRHDGILIDAGTNPVKYYSNSAS